MADQNQESNQGSIESNLAKVAAERFGNKYHAEPDSEELPEEPDEAESAEEPEEDTPEEAEAPEVEEPSEDSPEEFVSTFDELIESLDLDKDHVKGLKVRLKVDGEDVETTLGDVLATNQTLTAAEKRLESYKAKHAKEMESLAEERKRLSEAAAVAAKSINKRFEQLAAEEKKVKESDLKTDDPGSYSVKMEEFRDRRAALESEVNELRAEFQKDSEKQSKEAEKALQKRIEAEQQALLVAIPEWKDPKIFEKEGRAIGEMLSKDFSPEEIKNLYDHRAYPYLRDAMLYRQGVQKKSVTEKKIKKIPKSLKPGASRTADQRDAKKIRTLNERLDKSGKITDALALYRARRKTA